MTISQAVVEWCQTEALGQVLVAWGGDDYQIPYDSVIERLEDMGSDIVSDDEIVVWDAFEDNTASWIADQISSLYTSYLDCAKFAKEN